MPYDSIISRTDADSLIPQGQAEAVIKAATQESAALTLFNRAQLSTKISRQPVMSALPVAYWVAGDTGLKQTTEAAWAGVDLVAEEIACIVPTPEAAWTTPASMCGESFEARWPRRSRRCSRRRDRRDQQARLALGDSGEGGTPCGFQLDGFCGSECSPKCFDRRCPG